MLFIWRCSQVDALATYHDPRTAQRLPSGNTARLRHRVPRSVEFLGNTKGERW